MKGEKGKRRYFTIKEIEAVLQSAARRKILYCGMTFTLLRERYHRNVYHKAGVGFYYYPDSPRVKAKAKGSK